MAGAPVPSSSPSLTPWGWAVLLAKIGKIFAGLVCKSVCYSISSRSTHVASLLEKKRSFHSYIAYQGLIDFQCGLTAVEKQSILFSSSTTCQIFAQSLNLPHAKVTLPDGTIAHLLGGSSSSAKSCSDYIPFWNSSRRIKEAEDAKRNAKRVIVYFHGGGYAAPVLPQHLHLLYGLEKKPRWGEDVIVYLLAYSLASDHANPYPTQLRQAISLLDHVLNTENFPPSSITLIGNSAGSNLLLGLLLHLSHPNPDLPPLHLQNNEQLAAAAVISPWCTMEVSAAAMKANADKDVLAPSAIAYWGRNFLGGRAPDPWNTPLIAPAAWWGDVKVDEMLLLYGEDEILRDDTAILCETIKATNPTRTTVHRFQGECHEQMAMNKLLRLPGTCESEKVYAAWMKERFL
ncbi:hypothetical protein UA08_01100 [Talaromyces atroroseus]|uniref:Alpha/beta hydrolase fold-3 domain-containing protein n=1 Tax=Talaromyces atroroseus TaxID=1441469 RepID=A0A225BDC0_TALAT|nr:hypothetical protein UA08_01100 [Talaromyces atroroseus]OKL64017.1 hypothetical protein UA08_01100 [Talaromyces atroroseus]